MHRDSWPRQLLGISIIQLFVLGSCGPDREAPRNSVATVGAGGSGAPKSLCDNEHLCREDTDCAEGTCVPLLDGATDVVKVCSNPIVPATECTGNALDECCSSADCATNAVCQRTDTYGFHEPGDPVFNLCAVPCVSDADCANDDICAPAGVLDYPFRHCLPARCLRDADCTAEPGGECVAMEDHCNGGRVYQLDCVYPGGCCRSEQCGDPPFVIGKPFCDFGRCVVGNFDPCGL